MGLSPEKMMEAVMRNLPRRTGRTLDQWVDIARKSRIQDHRKLREWLKAAHGLGGTTSWIIADETLGSSRQEPASDAEALALQFKGERAALRPVYDRLVRLIEGLGPDVSVSVRKTQTTFSRNHTFAVAKGPTLTRIDLGLRLPGVRPTKRLQPTIAFSDNATHCVELSAPEDVDGDLGMWLKAAYDARG